MPPTFAERPRPSTYPDPGDRYPEFLKPSGEPYVKPLGSLSIPEHEAVLANIDATLATTSSVDTHHIAERWLDADAIPEVQQERQAGKAAALGIMEARMQQLRDGDFDAVPDLVDPLTTAARALQARETHGVDSEVYRQNRHSLFVDCQRYLAETYRKNAYEYFSPLKQEYDHQTGGHQYMGRQLRDMVRDGITPAAEPEEQTYRIAEYVEEVTFGATARALGGLAVRRAVSRAESLPGGNEQQYSPKLEDVTVFTISECADWAIDAYKRNPKSNYGHGYVPNIEKLMIRGVRYDANGDRYQEQVGVSGVYITHDIINEAMQQLRLVEPGQTLSKEDVRAKQIVNTEGKGVLDMLVLLDELASKASGQNIFMGEVIEEGHPKDYTVIPQEAAARQEKLSAESEQLADYLLMLEENGTDHGVALGLLDKYVQETVFASVKHDPEQAAIVFDTATAETLRQAVVLRESGNIQGALMLEQRAEQDAPPAGGCGAGSCGLVGVDPSSGEGAAMKSKLKAQTGDQVTRDTERACKECGEKGSVYYVHNQKKVNKGCAKCGATELNG